MPDFSISIFISCIPPQAVTFLSLYSCANIINQNKSICLKNLYCKIWVETANKADVIVAVCGEAADMTGEASSRSDISLPENQENLLKALVQTGKPVVLVLMSGRPLTINWENEHVNAILETWFPGIEAGNAIADVLFDNYNPGGKLSITFPR